MESNIFDVADDMSFPWLPAYAEAIEQQQQHHHQNQHQHPVSPLLSTGVATSSRMLETIVEETSSDDDAGDGSRSGSRSRQSRPRTSEGECCPNGWSQYDQVWSSAGSNTGSVIRVDTPSDQDAMSERDFICPPKRRRQDQQDRVDGTCSNSESASSNSSSNEELFNGAGSTGELTVIVTAPPNVALTTSGGYYGGIGGLRKARYCELDQQQQQQSLEVNEYFMRRHNEPRLRFDEIGHDLFAATCGGPDSDSLSYASLSRSSSLIQFESLERQLQNELQAVGSGSVPSLYSADPPVNGVGVAEGFYSPAKKPPPPSLGGAAVKLKVGGGVGVNGVKQSQPVLNNSDSELYSSSASSGGDSSGGSSCNYASDECDLNQHTPSPSSEESGRVAKGSSSDEADGPVQQLLLVRSCPQRCSERRLNRQNAAKNSIESLSEDSGYCDHLHFNMNNLRVRSKSLTNFGGSADNVNMFAEPVDFYERPSFQENRLSTVCDVDEEEEEQPPQQVTGESNKYEEQRWYGAKTNIHNCTKIDLDASKQQQQQPFVVQTKVMPTSSSSSSSSASTTPTSSQNASTDSLERPISTSDLDRHQPKPKNSNHRDEFAAASRKRPRAVISASSPDLFGVHAGLQVPRSRKQPSSSRKTSSDLLEFSVSSVPECLNLYGGGIDYGQSESLDSLSESGASSGNYCSWNVPQECSVASKNFDLYDLQEAKTAVVKKVTFQPGVVAKPRVNIRASYANLTVLDYSDEEEGGGGGRQYYLNRNTFRTSSGTRLGGVREMAGNGEEEGRIFPVEGEEKDVFNSLLDEISAHFDRNLSIINDQAEAYEPIAAFLHEQRSGQAASVTPFSALVAAPQPPPRRTQIKTNPHHSQQVTTIVVQPPDVKKRTFDQDPTNLVTCYAASLERCTFDPSESSLNLYGSKSSELNQPRGYAPVKREFVASTPNLNYYYSGGSGYGECEEGLHNSLKNVSCLEIGSRSTGILATASISKCGLSKGVSFCPIVSEIIWKDNCSELDPDDDNASVISNQDFEIDVDDEDFEPDDAEHANLTQTNTLLNANSIETGLCELMNDPSSTSHHQRTADNHQLRMPTPPERSPRESDADVTICSLSRESDDHERDGASPSNVNNNATTTTPLPAQLELLSNEVITAEERTPTMASAIANGDASRNLIAAEATAATSDDQQQVQGAAAATSPPKFVNNNNNLIKNFKNGKAEKKGKTFLSRLSSGFRFSFRGKGKKNKDGVVGGKTGNTGSAGGAGRSDKQQSNEKVSADFIYIPLKDPTAKQGHSNGINNGEIEPAAAGGVNDDDDDEERYLRQMNTVGLESCEADELDRAYDDASDVTFRSDSILNSTATSGTGNTFAGYKNHVLSGKPPLPKQPPRVVGVCAKRSGPAVARAHAQHRASSTPPRTEIDLDEDGSFRQYAAEPDTSRTSSVAGQRRYRANSSTTSAVHHHPAAAAGDTNFFNHIMGSEQKIGLIETNLDTHETVISGKTRSLMELGGPNQLQVHQVVISGGNGCGGGPGGKVNGIKDHRQTAANGCGVNEPGRPHKSMEFLLDKENQRNVLPPENELQKSHETGTNLSEHQLRVQASLQRLNIPDWYKQYSTGKDGGHPNNPNAPQAPPGTCAGTGILRKRNSDVGRWTGLSSKTTSLSSLGSHRSDRSPVMLSPSAHSHTGGQTGFSRWSTSHLNSNQTSPSVSTRGSFTRGGLNASVISGYSTASTTVGATAAAGGAPGTIRNSFRQPYLGWRSQEKLSQPRTPAERLASSLLSQQKAKEQQHQHHHQNQKSDPVVTPEIQSSIKEVTSAIVHYVNDQTNRHSRSRSTSPSQRCWLESSFVGTRPLDSPQTPMIEGQNQQQHQSQLAGDHYRYNAGRMNGVASSPTSAAAIVPTFSLPPDQQSPGSATLEDVLASLLGLPAESHRSSGMNLFQ
ncbi:uncharacterized protein LOC6038935 isoform X3 [Culex quinquefasciatus]|uniref:uncharacterized protein LOC6038935 isoform X3 n=1 Tax=Culex quinquefasciatus TaxID=7176 RepID=UPI0018E3231A|nr:uncharacterized protein LOC6038935 isoform X3 [Culex quinquefasciatus]